ncbi:tyrosine-type recombinase/integrase [Streptomyces sp. NBC_00320]|uniref:tyrosine-type recombinase/integrase n=1 Tax=Streptomyces sp. NBC_00320 TaxID=2975711 RepID=UPI002B1DE061|nr:tyrosine-type recombinase/integrase [Streptomyces sp. NBC_00320]
MAGKRRQFGRVRKLPSGRYQARYLGPDGQLRPAPETFRTKRDADDWLADKQTEMRRGDWQDPAAGKVAFGPWIKERELTSTTRQLYGSLLKHHLEPVLGAVNLAEISPPLVRSWRADKLAAGTGPTTVAKAYALLRAILGTAVSDELIRRNPCQVKGASTVHTPERPTATVQEVYALATAVQPRFRALVLMAGFLGLRWGELIGLHRRDIDLEQGTLRVRRAVAELENGQREIKAPKSAAGKRTVSIPGVIVPEIRQHLETYAEGGADGRVFIGAKGATPRRNHFNLLWHKACRKAGIKGCISMIYGTRGTPWPRQPVRVRGS